MFNKSTRPFRVNTFCGAFPRRVISSGQETDTGFAAFSNFIRTGVSVTKQSRQRAFKGWDGNYVAQIATASSRVAFEELNLFDRQQAKDEYRVKD
jgi:hypothetical protein